MKITKQQLEEIQADVSTQGWSKISNFLNEEEIEKCLKAAHLARTTYYTEKTLAKRISYLSDDTEARKSNAIMISKKENKRLPSVFYEDVFYPLVKSYNKILADLTHAEVAENSRTMINFQEYFAGSKPVRDHFDGEYLDYEIVGDYKLLVKKAILPQFVSVAILHNENKGSPNGIVLRNSAKSEVVEPELNKGDFIIFDNIHFRHSVPTLNKPRTIIGFRNFDHFPFHFIGERVFSELGLAPITALGWRKFKDEQNPGYLKSISSQEAEKIMVEFNKNVWPSKWKEVKAKSEAVF
tara:strand:+ start:468 stop:1355 length:888 start_codon:yes stop_codon:yes gene_type:complete